MRLVSKLGPSTTDLEKSILALRTAAKELNDQVVANDKFLHELVTWDENEPIIHAILNTGPANPAEIDWEDLERAEGMPLPDEEDAVTKEDEKDGGVEKECEEGGSEEWEGPMQAICCTGPDVKDRVEIDPEELERAMKAPLPTDEDDFTEENLAIKNNPAMGKGKEKKGDEAVHDKDDEVKCGSDLVVCRCGTRRVVYESEDSDSDVYNDVLRIEPAWIGWERDWAERCKPQDEDELNDADKHKARDGANAMNAQDILVIERTGPSTSAVKQYDCEKGHRQVQEYNRRTVEDSISDDGFDETMRCNHRRCVPRWIEEKPKDWEITIHVDGVPPPPVTLRFVRFPASGILFGALQRTSLKGGSIAKAFWGKRSVFFVADGPFKGTYSSFDGIRVSLEVIDVRKAYDQRLLSEESPVPR